MTYKAKLTILTNLLFVAYLLKTIFIDDLNDYVAIWIIAVALFLLLFSIYAYIIGAAFKNRMKKPTVLNLILYLLLLTVPVFILWYFTS